MTVGGDRSASRAAGAWGLAAVVVAAAQVAPALTHGWVPLDEGTLALSARYVAAGALPHLDFNYPYTGGLAFVGAAVARVAGDTMVAARYAMFVPFVAWLCATWFLARRYASPPASAAVVLLSAWWSVLIYPAAMPTWYILFLVTAALLALARWEESDRVRWLVVAGLACGAAIAIKQTGLYTFVGAGLGILAMRQQRALRAAHPARPSPVVLALLAFALALPVALVARRGVLSGEALTLAIPLAAVLVALAAREVRGGSGSFRDLLTAWGALTIGASVAPLLLLAAYAARGGVPALIEGLSSGTIRTASAIDTTMPSAWITLAHGGPVVLVACAFLRARAMRLQVAVAVLVAIAGGVAATQTDLAYRAVWYFAVLLVPIAALLAARLSIRQSRGALPAGILAIAAAMTLQALNQFPNASANYFGYVAPLAFLLLCAVAAHAGLSGRLTFVALLLIGYGGWFHRIGSVDSVGFGPVWWDSAHRLPGPHAGVLVTLADSTDNARLFDLTRAHGGPDSLVAGPELISLYALAGTKRVVRQPYLVVPERTADSVLLAATFNLAATRAVAINHAPRYLPPLRPDAVVWLALRFPNVERVGDVEFRWR